VKPRGWNPRGFVKQMQSNCTCPVIMLHICELCPSCEAEYNRIRDEEWEAEFNAQLDKFLAAPVQEVTN